MLKVTYVDHMGNDLRVVNSARISFGGESQQLEEKDKKLIKYLADNEHMSPFEHNVLTVVVECPLYIRSQIHRHRTFSYNEVSRRYTSDDIQFYIPDTVRRQAVSNRQASNGELDPIGANTAIAIMKVQHEQAFDAYNDMLALGVPREQARGVLPQNLMTKFYMTGNLRNWAHFVRLRIDNHAQAEVQDIGRQVLAILESKFPEATKALLGAKHD
jgi:thymidylate synthase (FAD)